MRAVVGASPGIWSKLTNHSSILRIRQQYPEGKKGPTVHENLNLFDSRQGFINLPPPEISNSKSFPCVLTGQIGIHGRMAVHRIGRGFTALAL